MKYSLVIPVFNESESLQELYREIIEVIRDNNDEMEIIFIDDGSTDSSWQLIESLCEDDSRIVGIRFRRNFGKAAALEAGIEQATKEYLITMDADLQDDPREIPEFLAMMKQGFDLVSGWKKRRHDPWHKVLPSWVFNFMVSRISGVKLHDHNCGMKSYRREIFDEVSLYGELHRFIPVLAASRGYRVGEKVIQHRARKFGSSKYGFNRFIKGFLDLLTVKFITGYGQRPQHFLGSVGLIAFTVGSAILTYLALCWCVTRIPCFGFETPYSLSGRPALIYSATLMLLGTQFLSTGLIAEMFVSNRHSRGKDYSIKTIVGKHSDHET